MLETIYLLIWVKVASASIYYHEPSFVALAPEPGVDHNTFGFSLAYQNGSLAYLVTGAPHSNLVGKIFRCAMDGVLSNKTNYCSDVNMNVETLAPYSRDFAPDLKFNLGLSVCATPDYFLTCAPLWTPTKFDNKFSFGTCFVNNGTTFRYQGMFEKFQEDTPDIQRLFGGTGWRTFVDLPNDLIIISKMLYRVDVLTLKVSDPFAQTQSLDLSSKRNTNLKIRNTVKYLSNIRNFGYAIASGKFFDNKTTYYAISGSYTLQERNDVYFMYQDNTEMNLITKRRSKKYIYVCDNEETISSMFGAAMLGTDLNNDGLSELLVGAPSRDDNDGGYETGALYIFLGGDMNTINENSRRRLIVGNKDGSKFGSTIAATDIDGDHLPEIIVSAPYEGSGLGAIYILSGFEINKHVLNSYSTKFFLSFLNMTQRIQRQDFKTFGYSLQVLPDMNDNGCDELAVGSPGSNSIMLLRCIPSAIVTVRAKVVGETQIIKEEDSKFEVKVCVTVKHSYQRRFYAKFIAVNEIVGNDVYIESVQRNVVIEVRGKNEGEKCENVIVNMIDNDQQEYTFTTTLKPDNDAISNSSEFDVDWVTPSPYSSMEHNLDISRHCIDKDCEPNLSLEIGPLKSNSSYNIGSSDFLTINLVVSNTGKSSPKSCFRLRVSGAPVAKFGCTADKDGYMCYLPTPFRRNKSKLFEIKFDMSQPQSSDRKLNIIAFVHGHCDNQQNNSTVWELNYNFNTEDVRLKGSSHKLTISDAEIQNLKTNTTNVAHEYLVENDSPVNWKSVQAIVFFEKAPYKESYKVSGAMFSNCEQMDYEHQVTVTCTFDLPPQSTSKLIASTIIINNKITNNLVGGKLEAKSSFTLIFGRNLMNRTTSLSTEIYLEKELSIGQDMNLVILLAVIGAMIALAVVIFILYKMDFFKRKEKTRLEQLKKQRLRRQGAIRRTLTEDERTSIIDEQLNGQQHHPARQQDTVSSCCIDRNANVDMEVIDDCPFEIVDANELVLNKVKKNNGDMTQDENEEEAKKQI